MFYGLVILRGILPDTYLKHFVLYMEYTILCVTRFAHSKVDLAESSLKKFVQQMEVLYGLSYCTFNVHQMTHFANGVRNCGPLWATSSFIFEANNHVLLKMFYGTQHVPWYFSDDANPAVVSMLQKLAGNMPQKNACVLENNVTALSSRKPTRLTASQVLAVMQLTNLPVHNRPAIVFHRFVANHQLYASRHYNYAVRVEQQERKYGNIAGLYVVKPECACSDAELQY